MPPRLSVIVPAFNEASRIVSSIAGILEYLEENYPDSELIVVDDGSSDDTLRVAERLLKSSTRISTSVIPVRPNRGKGHAVRLGLLAATAPIGLFTDADLSTPMTETSKLINPIERMESDLTFGSRALDRSLIGVHQPWRREQGGRVFNLLVRWATGLPFWDTQCGFKAFRLDVCRPLIEAATIERFGFDVELLYVAYQAGLRLSEVPVRWDHNDGSKVSVVRDSLRMFNEVRTIRTQSRRGVYDMAIEATRNIVSRDLEEPDLNNLNAESVGLEMTTGMTDVEETMKT